jgi:uncharacterized protein (DUF1697 family)
MDRGICGRASLAATGASSAKAFAAEIATELDSAAFEEHVAADLGVLITSVSASSAVVVANPRPTPRPTSLPRAPA